MDTSDKNIRSQLIINNQSVEELMSEYQYIDRWLCFGGMSIFTKDFVLLILKYTNFFQNTHLFQTRNQRCFFERILFLMANELIPDFKKRSIQGIIHRHPNQFRNKNPYANSSTYFTKIWVGR
jgi:hypothetical protein